MKRILAVLILTLSACSTGSVHSVRATALPPPVIWNDVPTTMDGVTVTADIASQTAVCTSTTPCPVVVLVHGGGYDSSGKTSWGADLKRFTGMYGFPYHWVTIAVNYRMACDPAHPPTGVDPSLCGYHWPTATDDVQAWVDWTAANVSTYGGDPNRLMMIGSSAGAQIADDIANQGHGVKAVGAWSAPSEFAPSTCASWCSLITNYLGCSAVACSDTWSAASSVNHVSPVTRPTYVANSDNEQIPLGIAQHYVDTLNANGVPNAFTVVPGTAHAKAYEGHVLPDGKTVLQDTADWLLGHL